MPINRSSNKISVVKYFGSGAIGLINPKVGMVTDYGSILAIENGSGTVVISRGTSSGVYNPVHLQLAYSSASGNFGFESGHNGAVKFGHYREFPTGFTKGSGNISGYKLGVNSGVDVDIKQLTNFPSVITN